MTAKLKNKPVARQRKRGFQLHVFGFLFPAMALLTLFGLLPLLVAGVVSFTDMNIKGLGDWSKIEFIGLDNYGTLVSDPDFSRALFNTAIFIVIGVPAIVIISLLVALMLNESQGRLFRLLRAFYFMPAITAVVAISLIWGYLYNSQFGLLNHALSLIGLGPVRWLSDPVVAKLSVALVGIWRASGLNIIIFLAALQGIPREYDEAAQIDGANKLQRTLRITIPQLKFALLFVIITTMINWMQFFDEPYVLTDGGPLGATTSASIFLFKEGFMQNKFGYASAGSVVLFAIIIVITTIQLVARKKDYEV